MCKSSLQLLALYYTLAILVSRSGASSPLDPRARFDLCSANFLKQNNTDGAVDLYGNSVSSMDQAWGMRYATCYTRCGNGWQRAPWLSISAYLATWLIPWIALVGQLPFQTSSWINDCLSAGLMIGSPVCRRGGSHDRLSNSRHALPRPYLIEFAMGPQKMSPGGSR